MVTVYPCAKINLGLNVVKKRSDGYHDLETLFYPVRLFDEINFTLSTSDKQNNPCELEVEGITIAGDVQGNLVVKAYNLLANHFKMPNISIKLKKRIPTQAGLGGGSADCAFTIKALNKICGLGMNVSEMQNMAAKLGADCAFFIESKPAYAEGIGEKLMPVSVDLSNYKIVIVKPTISISTKEAFAQISPKRPKVNCRDVVKLPVETWKDLLVNDFENSVIPQYPLIGQIKQKLYDMGAVYAAMSGSGSALFALFRKVPTNIVSEFENCATFITDGGYNNN